jgi:hypothetical protein
MLEGLEQQGARRRGVLLSKELSLATTTVPEEDQPNQCRGCRQALPDAPSSLTVLAEKETPEEEHTQFVQEPAQRGTGLPWGETPQVCAFPDISPSHGVPRKQL